MQSVCGIMILVIKMRKKVIPKEFLEQKYIKENLTLKQISELLGVSRQTVANKLNEYGLQIRNSSYISEKKSKKRKFVKVKKEPLYRNKEDFQKVYSELKSLDLVAKHYGINLTTACDWKQRHGLPTIHEYSRAGKSSIATKPYMNKEWLEKMYSQYSWEDLGKMLGVSPTTLSKWGVKFGIKTRTISEQWDLKSKSGNHCVIDDSLKMKTYMEAYASGQITKIPKKLKYFILDLYGKCEADGCNEMDVLDLHHIDGNHLNNNPENHSCLCPNCHAKIHRLGIDFNSLVKHHRVWSDILNEKYSYQEAK